MQQKTSLINKTVLKKDITRYSPIWAVYAIFLLLALFEFGSYNNVIAADNILEKLIKIPLLNIFERFYKEFSLAPHLSEAVR